jgi:phosphoribosyl 1,2-cyclic phosphodiesterase
MTFRVKFWGVRGSIACPTPNHIGYGGNTSCIEMNLGGLRIALDAGTGVRGLGQVFLKDNVSEITLLLTHTHWDHINGFPFFLPAYDPRRTIAIRAGHLGQRGSTIRDVLSQQMDLPMFPVPIEAMKAELRFEDFVAGESFELQPGVLVRTAPLNHPNGATGYRLEYKGKSACYITDTEHVPANGLDQNILDLIADTDLVIYDSTYTDEEWKDKVGWGHSTWTEGMRLCQTAGAKRLAIFHHDPDHDDTFMDKVKYEAEKAWSGNFVAREGMEINLEKD